MRISCQEKSLNRDYFTKQVPFRIKRKKCGPHAVMQECCLQLLHIATAGMKLDNETG